MRKLFDLLRLEAFYVRKALIKSIFCVLSVFRNLSAVDGEGVLVSFPCQ